MDAATLDRLEAKLKVKAYVFRAVVSYFPPLEDLDRLAQINHWTEEQSADAVEAIENLRGELIERAACLDPVRPKASVPDASSVL